MKLFESEHIKALVMATVKAVQLDKGCDEPTAFQLLSEEFLVESYGQRIKETPHHTLLMNARRIGKLAVELAAGTLATVFPRLIVGVNVAVFDEPPKNPAEVYPVVPQTEVERVFDRWISDMYPGDAVLGMRAVIIQLMQLHWQRVNFIHLRANLMSTTNDCAEELYGMAQQACSGIFPSVNFVLERAEEERQPDKINDHFH